MIAKAPVAGRVKTRLCPPCEPDQASALAEAALTDTLDAVVATPGVDPVVVLDGRPGPWLPDGVPVVAQRGGGLAERIAHAFADVGTPTVLIGMDTPQVTPDLLGALVDDLRSDGTDAVIGLAVDGGFWTIGLADAEPSAFRGVAMSRSTTGHQQLARLRRLGLKVAQAPTLADVDTWEDAVEVAAAAPTTRFARAVRALGPVTAPP